MNSREALEFLTEHSYCPYCSKYEECHQLDESETICENAKFIIRQDLKKLEKLNMVFRDSHTIEIQNEFNKIECSSDKCETCPLCIGDGICIKVLFEIKWRLQGENANLRNEIENLHNEIKQHKIIKKALTRKELEDVKN